LELTAEHGILHLYLPDDGQTPFEIVHVKTYIPSKLTEAVDDLKLLKLAAPGPILMSKHQNL
jgi:hypothetical protein